MCQLLGMNSNSSAAITFSLTGFTQRGGNTADHIDGWGIAFYERNGSRVFHDDLPASESPLAEFLRDYPIKSRIVIAHIRKATQGAATLANCHPFQREWLGQNWFFANNGDLRNFHPALNGLYMPVGGTDSEKAFCWIMQELRKRFSNHQRAPAWQEVAPQLSEITAEISKHGNFNYLLSNGDALYAHCSTKLHYLRREYPFPKASLIDCDMSIDLGSLNTPNDQMIMIATEPLTADEVWQPFSTGELKVFVNGAEELSRMNDSTRVFPVPTETTGRIRTTARFMSGSMP